MLSATDECQISEVRHGEESLDPKDGEYDLRSLAGYLSVTLDGRQDLRLPLVEHGRPLIFKLGAHWGGPGRRINHLTHGHFIVIAPQDWDREGHVPVNPEDCTDSRFRAHYFHRTKGGSEEMAFKQCRIALSRTLVRLQGHSVFDDSEEGSLFGGSAPPTLADAPEVVWARVGSEGDDSWPGKNFQPAKQALAEVLNGRQGRFFVRVYDSGLELLDSREFRYVRGLQAIHVNDKPYAEQSVLAPSPEGHQPAKIRFVGADAGVEVGRPTDHATADGDCVLVDPIIEADTVLCALESSCVNIKLHLPRIWWRMDWTAQSTDADQWYDTPPKLTRREFAEYADSGAALRVRLPNWFKGAQVGFDGEQGRRYSTESMEGGYSSLTVRLADFYLHRQIDQRLNNDAFLCVEIDEEQLPLIRILRDPMPRIVQFSCHPLTILRGERSTLRWDTRDAEADGVAIEPDIGPVSNKGAREVMPSTDSSYTLRLTATGADDVTATVDVTVQSERYGGVPERQAATVVAHVRCRHGGLRPGKGFSTGELRAASMTAADAKRRLIPFDKRRRTTHTTNTAILGRLPDA